MRRELENAHDTEVSLRVGYGVRQYSPSCLGDRGEKVRIVFLPVQ
jgi:hypothetical protein